MPTKIYWEGNISVCEVALMITFIPLLPNTVSAKLYAKQSSVGVYPNQFQQNNFWLIKKTTLRDETTQRLRLFSLLLGSDMWNIIRIPHRR